MLTAFHTGHPVTGAHEFYGRQLGEHAAVVDGRLKEPGQ